MKGTAEIGMSPSLGANNWRNVAERAQHDIADQRKTHPRAAAMR